MHSIWFSLNGVSFVVWSWMFVFSIVEIYNSRCLFPHCPKYGNRGTAFVFLLLFNFIFCFKRVYGDKKKICICAGVRGCGGWLCVEIVRTEESVLIRELPYNIDFSLLLAREMLTNIHSKKGKIRHFMFIFKLWRNIISKFNYRFMCC